MNIKEKNSQRKKGNKQSSIYLNILHYSETSTLKKKIGM